MSVTMASGSILLVGLCPLEDAEELLSALLAAPGAGIDWTQCEGAHSAVIQVLLAAERTIEGPPKGGSLRRWIEPSLQA
jgi:hypothetical protein